MSKSEKELEIENEDLLKRNKLLKEEQGSLIKTRGKLNSEIQDSKRSYQQSFVILNDLNTRVNEARALLTKLKSDIKDTEKQTNINQEEAEKRLKSATAILKDAEAKLKEAGKKESSLQGKVDQIALKERENQKSSAAIEAREIKFEREYSARNLDLSRREHIVSETTIAQEKTAEAQKIECDKLVLRNHNLKYFETSLNNRKQSLDHQVDVLAQKERMQKAERDNLDKYKAEIEEKKCKLETQSRGIENTAKALESQKQEVRLRELKVERLIKEKGIEKEIKEIEESIRR